MNLATILVLAVVTAVFAAIILVGICNRKKGKGACACSCGASCAGCPMSGKCHGGGQPGGDNPHLSQKS